MIAVALLLFLLGLVLLPVHVLLIVVASIFAFAALHLAAVERAKDRFGEDLYDHPVHEDIRLGRKTVNGARAELGAASHPDDRPLPALIGRVPRGDVR